VRLNLGAGGRVVPDVVNVDRVPGPGIDVVHDLDVHPWPWADNSASAITARDLFEHLVDAVGFMVECHRILVPGCTLWIRTPNVALNAADAFTDPTHRRFPTWQTFDYWVPGTRYHAEHNAAYGAVSFEKVVQRPDDGSMVVVLAKLAPGSGQP